MDLVDLSHSCEINSRIICSSGYCNASWMVSQTKSEIDCISGRYSCHEDKCHLLKIQTGCWLESWLEERIYYRGMSYIVIVFLILSHVCVNNSVIITVEETKNCLIKEMHFMRAGGGEWLHYNNICGIGTDMIWVIFKNQKHISPRNSCPVGWGCRIHRLHLWRGNLPTNVLDMTLNNPMVRMRSTPSMPSLPGLLCVGVVTPDRVQSMGQIDQKCILTLNWIT